jgi:hypothetical protein
MFRKLRKSSASIRLLVDGVTVEAEPGETVAAVLLRTSPFYARRTPISGEPRAPYCMMGVCFDCLAVVDDKPSTQTCLTIVSEGMRVEREEKGADLHERQA